MSKKRERVIVGLSGGVDSSVAAACLCEEGYEVHGLFMFNWDEDEQAYCTAAEDFQDARSICDTLDIPLHQVDFSDEYRDRVFAYFLQEYEAGRTPNPDVLCNREIKFGVFFEYAKRLGAKYIATGHYARVQKTGDNYHLLKGLDANKDQSYFLHAIDQAALASTLFPVGELEKSEVRRRARDLGFDNHAKKDSTGICFIGERHFRHFLAQYLPARPGNICTADGETIGSHQGLMYYTLGQRQGLGIGGQAGLADAPWYVADKDLDRNRLIVVQGHDHELLHSDALTATAMHWISGIPVDLPTQCMAKTRYRQSDQECSVSTDGHGLKIEFASSQRAVTPGQFVVLYDNDICLGGGVIDSIERHGRQEKRAAG